MRYVTREEYLAFKRRTEKRLKDMEKEWEQKCWEWREAYADDLEEDRKEHERVKKKLAEAREENRQLRAYLEYLGYDNNFDEWLYSEG